MRAPSRDGAGFTQLTGDVGQDDRFIHDLEVAWRGLLPNPSPDFIRDILLAYPTARAKRSPIDDSTLHLISQVLADEDREQRQRLGKRLQELPEDDVLRTCVSLFRPLTVGRLETAHTRTLAWLLDDTGSHGFGSVLFEAFLFAVGHRIVGALDMEHVSAEYFADGGNGRFDIIARWGEKRVAGPTVRNVLLVEAKIDAAESSGQLSGYDDWLANTAHSERIVRVFLTPDGVEPETSRSKKWVPMKFLALFSAFRSCLDGLRTTPGYHFLKMYLAGIALDVFRWPLPVREDVRDPALWNNLLDQLDSLRLEK